MGGDGPIAVCKHCGAKAVGPCAQCKKPVCGDCCVLTEGGVGTWAICLECESSDGRSLRSGWVMVLTWVLAPIAVLLVLVLLLSALT